MIRFHQGNPVISRAREITELPHEKRIIGIENQNAHCYCSWYPTSRSPMSLYARFPVLPASLAPSCGPQPFSNVVSGVHANLVQSMASQSN